jgi:hypothetical protein
MVGDRFVVRLQKDLPSPGIDALNDQFADIVSEGKIEKTEALPEEANEPELIEKPRIVFVYDHKSAGRLRQLIDEINKLGRFA